MLIITAELVEFLLFVIPERKSPSTGETKI
jgi:hypothetical protein